MRVAWVDLDTGAWWEEHFDAEAIRFLGGRGLAAWLLYRHVGESVGPLDPDNVLIFACGRLTGYPWPSAARYSVTAKSPATGCYGYANGSGFFGPELRRTGFDAIAVRGRARAPSALVVERGRIELVPVPELWGRTTEETELELRRRYPGARVASIGPAGERGVVFAAVINDLGRAAARTGMGAVMGSKNLKAVVARGDAGPRVGEEFRQAARQAVGRLRKHAGCQLLGRWGTAVLIRGKNIRGDLPSKNHRWGQFPWAEDIDADALARYTVATAGCFACPVRCSRVTEVKSGAFQTPRGEGPEYETINALGCNLWNRDLESIIHANRLCNLLGLDTISTGMAISFAMECREAGLLPRQHPSPAWGDPQGILELIRAIAFRQGLGDLLAEGVARAAALIGPPSERMAMHVKGVELPRQEGRVLKAFALAHATSNRGADHLYALPTIDSAGLQEVAEKYFPRFLPEIMDVTSEKYKGYMLRFTEAYNAVADCLGVCKFTCTENYALLPEDFAPALRALGLELTAADLIRAGERVVNLERMYNVRHGLDRSSDRLPERFLKEPLDVYMRPEDIEHKGLDEAGLLHRGLLVDLDAMLDEYYAAGGWTTRGIPTAARLREVGLEDLVRDLPGGGEDG